MFWPCCTFSGGSREKALELDGFADSALQNLLNLQFSLESAQHCCYRATRTLTTRARYKCADY